MTIKPEKLTAADYRRSATINLLAAKIMRQRRDTVAAAAHLSLADLYIKQELRRAASTRNG